MENTAFARGVIAKVTQRLIPFLFVLYIFNFLDRFNVSAAALAMKPDLGFSEAVYGLGASIFFLGYFIFEVPSNLIMERVGARRWIARIMISWGVISSAMMFVTTPWQFYLLRFLLGVAEAGFFPGVVLYLTWWFPQAVRAQAAAKFMVATTVAGIIGNPLAAALMRLDGVAQLQGWQWLFLIEGIPSVLLGIAVLFYLTERPEKAHWLTKEERDWLVAQMHREQTASNTVHLAWQDALKHPRVLHLAGLFLLIQTCGNGLGFFNNQILKERAVGWSDEQVLLMNAVPAVFGVASMLIAARFSDRSGERRKFVVGGLMVESILLIVCAKVAGPWATLVCFALIGMAGAARNAPFWALSTSFLSGSAAAGGIAFINSVGNLGGLIGPTLVGKLKETSGSYDAPLLVLAGCYITAVVVASRLQEHRPVERGEIEAIVPVEEPVTN